MNKYTESDIARFNAKVQKGDEPDGCHLWTKSRTGAGYGQFSHGSRKLGTYRMLGAHRVAYEIEHGEIPEGRLLRHRCGNPRCVNPTHLIPGTEADNYADRYDQWWTLPIREPMTADLIRDVMLLADAGLSPETITADFGLYPSETKRALKLGREQRAWDLTVWSLAVANMAAKMTGRKTV